MPLVLLVASKSIITTTIHGALRRAGFQTDGVDAGWRALLYLESIRPDLVIVDWSLSDMVGPDLAVQLRRKVADDLPLLALGGGNSEMEAIASLEAGADCFLPAPVQINLLVAQVQSMLRRSSRQRPFPVNGSLCIAPPVQSCHELRHEGLVIDPASHTAVLHDLQLTLTPSEFQLLALFVSQPGRLFSRSDVLKAIWQDHYFPGDRSVDNIVLRLRRKLGDCGRMIETVWGLGYRLGPCSCQVNLANGSATATPESRP
jgi:DNA-binding response OmpR family regulator